MLLIVGLITAGLTWIAHFTSFYASSAALVIAGITLLIFRPSLWVDSLMSGVLLVVASIPFYAFIELTAPSWIQHTYLWATLSGVRLVGVPIEEFIFWFLAGFVFGPLYEYWRGEALAPIRTRS